MQAEPSVAYFEGKQIVGEDNDLVASRFVILNQKLTSLELVGVHRMQERLFVDIPSLPEVLPIEYWCHLAAHFDTLQADES